LAAGTCSLAGPTAGMHYRGDRRSRAEADARRRERVAQLTADTVSGRLDRVIVFRNYRGRAYLG
jgi:hypothetical protein